MHGIQRSRYSGEKGRIGLLEGDGSVNELKNRTNREEEFED